MNQTKTREPGIVEIPSVIKCGKPQEQGKYKYIAETRLPGSALVILVSNINKKRVLVSGGDGLIQ